MSFIPSIRTCLERARAALDGTPGVIANLVTLERELMGTGVHDEAPPPQFAEHAEAIAHLRCLHVLVTDMAANIRNGGQAREPEAPKQPRLPTESVYKAPRTPPPVAARPPIGDWPPSPPKAAAKRKGERTPTGAPAGSISTAAAVKRLGVSTPTFYKLRAKPGFPKPLGRYFGLCMYSAEALDAYIEQVRSDVQELQRRAAAVKR